MSKEMNLKLIVQAIDRVTKPARQMGAALGDISRRAKLERLQINLRRALERLQALAAVAQKVGKRLSEMGGGAFKKLTLPLAAVGGFALNAFGKMEQLQTSFKSMLGNAEAAKNMVKKLSDFAANTPFQLQGIGAAARQLLSFGVAQGDVVKRLRMLGDISAGANVPLSDMAAIFGKAKAKGKAMTEELLQLSDRGVPIIDTLAKGLGKTKDEIFTLASQGKISFAILARAMQSMTSEGGVFYKQMDEQSKTLFGKLSTLRDNITLFLVQVGDVIAKTFGLKNGIDGLIVQIQKLRDGFEDFAKANPVLVKTVFVFGAMAAVAGPVLMALGQMSMGIGGVATAVKVLGPGIAAVVSVFGNLIAALRAGYSAMAALNVVFAANPFGLIVVAAAALAGAAYLIYRNWEPISNFFKGIWSKVANIFNEIISEITTAFKTGFLDGMLKLFELFTPQIWVAKGVNALIKYLFDIDLAKAGRNWIGGFESGIKGKWADLVAWLANAVTGLMDWMPDWVKEHLGFDGAGQLQIPNAAAGAQAPAIKPVIGPQSGTSHTRVGGEIKVAFENAPTNMRVKSIKSDNPDVTPSVDAGYLMSGL
jgi:tape measure domain-containing protein